MSSPVDITVVLCTFNRAHWLPAVVTCLANQHTGDAFTFELLIVDNASADDTPQTAVEQMALTDRPTRYVREETPGVSAARNRGIREAHGEWIAFCDDDQLADPQWLSELFKLAENRNCRVVGGAVHLVRTAQNGELDDLNRDAANRQPASPQAAAREAIAGNGPRLSPYLEKLLAPGGRSRIVQRFHRRDALNSGNQMVHRSVFEQVGDYDVNCHEGGEDTDWFCRLEASGIEAWFTPTASVRHLVPDYRLSVEYLRWVSLRQGWGSGRHHVDHRGLLTACLMGLARLGQAVLLHAPQLLFARLAGQSERALYCRCRLWRATGFCRYLLRHLSPAWFPQQDFRSRIEFRAERDQFTIAPLSQAIPRS